MASIKSVFSAGAGKVKEIAGLQYNDAGSLDVTLPISSDSSITGSSLTADDGAGGGLITSASLNVGSAALAATSFAVTATPAGTGGDAALATAGYVDAQVAVIASGVSLQDFTVAATTNLAAGQVVCLAAGTNAPLARADKDADLTSNAIGVIKSINDLVVTVQLDAEIAVPALGGLTTVGEPAFVGDNGAILPYSNLGPGDFATQVGYVSDVAGKKIVLVLKTFGQLA